MQSTAATTHGGSTTTEYATWCHIVQRCTNPENPAYDDYGGRGITIDAAWRGENGFANFLANVGPRPSIKHTIERRDNSLGYQPGNCRWATTKEQARNRRSNVHVTYEGRDHVLIELAELKGFPYKLLWKRVVQRGWSVERALTTPQDAATAQAKHVFTYAGKTLTLRQWAAELRQPYQTLYDRVVRRGRPFAESIT